MILCCYLKEGRFLDKTLTARATFCQLELYFLKWSPTAPISLPLSVSPLCPPLHTPFSFSFPFIPLPQFPTGGREYGVRKFPVFGYRPELLGPGYPALWRLVLTVPSCPSSCPFWLILFSSPSDVIHSLAFLVTSLASWPLPLRPSQTSLKHWPSCGWTAAPPASPRCGAGSQDSCRDIPGGQWLSVMCDVRGSCVATVF